jgi:hypothetical protein
MRSLIKIEASDKLFSAKGGLILCRDMLDELKLSNKIAPYLPKTERNVFSGEQKFESMVLGFQAGNEHLDDWDDLNKDPGYDAIQRRCYGSKSLGDYLRSFTGSGLHMLRRELIDLSFNLRSKLQVNNSPFILDLDSSSHMQYGKKTEGVEYCYKNFPALDSIVAFDELGLQYWHDVRPGSTYTSNGSGQIIHEIFSRMPTPKQKQRRIVRADSGFFNSEFFNACSVKGTGFVCAAKKTEHVMDRVFRIKNWESQRPDTKNRIIASGGRDCEIGHTSYHTEGYSGSLRLVVIRAKKPKEEGIIFEDHCEYNYYCFVTNMGSHEYSSVELINLYRGRGNAENFIKEQKYGFDLKHFPCLKLIANKAFGLIAAFSYTLMRFISLLSPRKKKTKKGIISINHYAKKIRNKWLHLPVQVIRHAGDVIFRFNRRHYKEIVYWQEKLKILQFECS